MRLGEGQARPVCANRSRRQGGYSDEHDTSAAESVVGSALIDEVIMVGVTKKGVTRWGSWEISNVEAGAVLPGVKYECTFE